jgi:hypothetical protein
MSTKTTRTRRLVKRFALALAVAAVAAPGSQAGNGISIPDELSGRQFGPTALRATMIPGELSGRQFGPSGLALAGVQVTIPGALSGRQFGPAELPLAVNSGIPDELSQRQFGPTALPLVSIPDELAGREFGPASFTAQIPAPQATSDGFDYRDAGVGAAIAMAVLLALMAGALLATRRREHQHLAA